MRLRNIPGARDKIAADRFVIQQEDQRKMPGRWASLYSQVQTARAEGSGILPAGIQQAVTLPAGTLPPGAQGAGLQEGSLASSAADLPPACPLHIEIGMGKGQFLTRLAMANPRIHYVGIEKYSSVLLRAVQKREKLEADGTHLDNLLYLRMDAEQITDVFGPAEVSRIYLNFSDPWPKDRHHKRRLESREFLARYRKVLAPGGWIEFKTDNRVLFDFAVEEARASGWTIGLCTYDLHADAELMKNNIMTEYEEKFSAQGSPICKMIYQPGS